MPKFLTKSNGNRSMKCTVRLLEDPEFFECEFQANHKGKFLLDYVCKQLNLIEKDYFGLRYMDKESQRQWLDPSKSILKQVKGSDSPILFSFRVKYYPPKPFQLKEQITRYQMYLQLKRDLLRGRLYSNKEDILAQIGAFVLQLELGDYSIEQDCMEEFKIFSKQTASLKNKMREIRQNIPRGLSMEEVEIEFLKSVCVLDSYGIDPHPVKDQLGEKVYLGLNYSGILTFQSNKKVNHFKWTEIQKINFEGKMFIIHSVHTEKKQMIGFKCPTVANCRYVWRCALEQMLFFTCSSSSTVPKVVSGGGFFQGSKFRYSGRVEREVLEEMSQIVREEPTIQRSASFRKKSSSVPATPSTPMEGDINMHMMSQSHSSSFPRPRSNLESRFMTEDSSILEPLLESAPANAFGRRKDCMDEAAGYNNVVENEWNDGGIENLENGVFRQCNSETTLFRAAHVKIDLSSSDGHIPNNNTPKPSRTSTPILRTTTITRVDDYDESIKESWWRKCGRFLKFCVPTMAMTMVSMLIILAVVFETEYEVFGLIRRAPEMVSIRREYYEPAKAGLRGTIEVAIGHIHNWVNKLVVPKEGGW